MCPWFNVTGLLPLWTLNFGLCLMKGMEALKGMAMRRDWARKVREKTKMSKRTIFRSAYTIRGNTHRILYLNKKEMKQ